jgi:2-dehydro-3-deoxyphosphogluconate aldolase/(4S)-4-hydroxy-2-oxoglutarate aldolase
VSGIDDVMALAPVIPVLTVERAADAAPLARALVAGGLSALEVTLRTPAALDVVRAMRDIDGAVVGAGTALNGADVAAAFAAGAQFIVSPGLTESVAERAAELGVPLLAGVATASDIMRGLELGLDRFKFFPAVSAGGVAMLKAFAGPFALTRFCPTGGITPQSAPQFLALPNVSCVGGTWIAPPDLVAAGAFAEIESRARAAAALRA